jgi:tetratricopeptide (TPR) repeat protein
MKRAGYRTGAFIGAFVLDARFGLAHDFDEYDDRLPHQDRASFHFAERRAADVVEPAANWMLRASPSTLNPQPSTNPSPLTPNPSTGPFFCWLHLFDPHAPYDAPAEFRPGRAPYDAEVAYADAMLGQLLKRLDAAGQLANTLVIVTADHGESLGEHGETTHGLFAYDSTIHVPLIVSAPTLRPAVVNDAVAHADLAPTILDLIGAAIPEGLDGQSLAQTLRPDRPLYFEAMDANLTRGWAPLRGVTRGGWKYIDLPDAELYDLATDPAEQHNRTADRDREQSMQRALADIESSRGGSAPQAALDPDAAARLRSLGYTGGTAAPSHAPTLADDPKRLAPLNEAFNSALTAFDERRTDEALASLTDILESRPDFLSARTSAATVLLSVGRPGDAVKLLRTAPATQQTSAELLEKLGAALRDAGDLRGSAAVLEQAQKDGDKSPTLRQDLAIAYAGLGRIAEARRVFTDLIAEDPSSATLWYNLGLLELQSGRPADASAALRKAVDREPSYGDAWQALGAALVKSDPQAALDAWQRAERLLPRDYDLLFNLGMLASRGRQPAAAVPYLERFVREAPRPRYERDIQTVQQTLARLERSGK